MEKFILYGHWSGTVRTQSKKVNRITDKSSVLSISNQFVSKQIQRTVILITRCIGSVMSKVQPVENRLRLFQKHTGFFPAIMRTSPLLRIFLDDKKDTESIEFVLSIFYYREVH